MIDIFHQPGFLGTSANWAADMTLVLSILVAVLLSIGAFLAWRGQYGIHRVTQTTAVIVNAILVLWMMILPFRDYALPANNPAGLPGNAVLITRMHGLIGATTLIFGVFVMLRGNGLVPRFMRFNNYKPYMRLAYTLYMITTLIGLFVYISWFVGNPNPPTY